MKLQAAGKRSVGRCRTWNEDSFLIDERLGVFLVADGCASTEVAPLALRTIVEYLSQRTPDELDWTFRVPAWNELDQRVSTAIKLANQKVFHAARSGQFLERNCGATMAGLFFSGSLACFAHIGDCRVYQIHDSFLELLSEDQTLLNEYIKMAALTPEEIENFPHKNVIIQGLGMKETIKVKAEPVTLREGDTYLLCTDGLYNDVSEREILQIIEEARDNLTLACDNLLFRADENGGRDNSTVVLVRCST